MAEKGSLISLKAACVCAKSNDGRTEKSKEILVESIKKAGSDRTVQKTISWKRKRNCSEKTVLLGWMHFDIFKRKYISVRQARGGGIQHESFNNNVSANEITQKMKSYFFVGRNSFHGKEEEIEFMLGNFQGEKIIPENFKLVNYILQNKLSKTRLYLLTKKNKKKKSKKKEEINEGNLSSTSSSELSDDCILLPEQPLLIGSTTERLALREEIDRAYEESAKIDQIKDASKQQEEIAHVDIVNRRKKLREERAARVLPVPSIILHPATVVQVRHIPLGLVNCIFKDDSIMQNVYDWIGNLQEEPKFFSLH